MFEVNLNEIGDHYYLNANRILLNAIGLWPAKSWLYRATTFSITTLIVGSAIVPHVFSIFMRCGEDFKLCTENIAGFFYQLFLTVKITGTMFCDKEMKKMFILMMENWRSITDPEEIQVRKKVSDKGFRRYVIYAVYMTFCLILFSQAIMIPVYMDIIKPLNESRQRLLIFNADYIFFNPHDYYYHVFVYYSLVYSTHFFVLMSTDGAYLSGVYQSIGIVEIIKVRLNRIKGNCEEDYKHLISAAKLYQEFLDFYESLQSAYSLIFGASITIGGIVLIFAANYIIESTDEPLDFLRMTFAEIAVAVYIFYTSWPGQMLTDANENLFTHMYMINWYDLTKKEKKALMIMRERCSVPIYFVAGGFYPMNFENFGIVMKTAISYMTVLASFRE